MTLADLAEAVALVARYKRLSKMLGKVVITEQQKIEQRLAELGITLE